MFIDIPLVSLNIVSWKFVDLGSAWMPCLFAFVFFYPYDDDLWYQEVSKK